MKIANNILKYYLECVFHYWHCLCGKIDAVKMLPNDTT